MSSPYVGEIRMFASSFAPAGWAMCNGQQVPISQNDTLFTLIGTMYGGDGQETFNLPDMQGRAPIHAGTGTDGINYQQAEKAGVESVTLTIQQIPVHSHSLLGTLEPATKVEPTGALLGTSGVVNYARETAPNNNMNANSLTAVGGSQPHDNMMPYLVITFILSLYGIYPTQT
jgi:microcystin-dependent protein